MFLTETPYSRDMNRDTGRTRGTMVGCRAANSSNPTSARSVSVGKKLNSLACVESDPALFQGSPMDGSAPDCNKKGVECQFYPGTIKSSPTYRKE